MSALTTCKRRASTPCCWPWARPRDGCSISPAPIWTACVNGLDFLRDVNLGKETKLSGRVVVIGGGNVAMDVARTAVRLGAKSVRVACIESREEMPANKEEVAATEAEIRATEAEMASIRQGYAGALPPLARPRHR